MKSNGIVWGAGVLSPFFEPAFLRGLVKIGYDGPVGTEPFDKSLSEMSAEEAMTTATAAMKKAFALIG
jgi:sugar phosphate isomerase/epimerase